MKKFDIKRIAMKTAGLTAGNVAARFADKHIPASVSPLIKGIILAVGGAMIADQGGAKNGFMSDFGDGMTAAGGAMIARHFMPTALSGLGELGGPDDLVLASPDGDYVANVDGPYGYDEDTEVQGVGYAPVTL
jgi:hypothetical protein